MKNSPIGFNPSLDDKDRAALKSLTNMGGLFVRNDKGEEDLSDAGVALCKMLYTDPETKKLPTE